MCAFCAVVPASFCANLSVGQRPIFCLTDNGFFQHDRSSNATSSSHPVSRAFLIIHSVCATRHIPSGEWRKDPGKNEKICRNMETIEPQRGLRNQVALNLPLKTSFLIFCQSEECCILSLGKSLKDRPKSFSLTVSLFFLTSIMSRLRWFLGIVNRKMLLK